MEPKVPAWVTVMLGFLALTPISSTVIEVQKALEDGSITTPEIGHILREAAAQAQQLVPGDAPEEQLAVDVTKALATYFDAKFPPEPEL